MSKAQAQVLLFITVLALLCVLIWTPARAQLSLPPEQYDHTPKMPVTVERVTKDQLLAQCYTATKSSLGCAFPSSTSCRIIIVDDAAMRADGRGWTYELMFRHERAHCNGWPQAHPNLRYVQ